MSREKSVHLSAIMRKQEWQERCLAVVIDGCEKKEAKGAELKKLDVNQVVFLPSGCVRRR